MATIFPVGHIKRQLENSSPNGKATRQAAVYTAAVMDYLVGEIFSTMQNFATPVQTVTPRHLQLGIRGDEELYTLLEEVIRNTDWK